MLTKIQELRTFHPNGLSRLIISKGGEEYQIARFHSDEPIGKIHRSEFICYLDEPIQIYMNGGTIRMFCKYLNDPNEEEKISEPEIDSDALDDDTYYTYESYLSE